MAKILVLGGIPESLVSFRRKLLEKMVAEKHEVYACAPRASKEIKFKLKEMGVIYEDIYLSRASMNPIKDLISLFKLTILVNRIKPDIFLGYTIKPVVYGSLAARMAGVKKIFSMIEGLGYSFTGTGAKRKFIHYIAQHLYRITLKYQEKVFFLNPDDCELFIKMRLIAAPSQAVLINGIGVDLEEFVPVSYPEKISFLLIGRLVRDKGIYEYVDAARIIKKEYPNIEFKIVGFIDKNPSAITEEELYQWVESDVIKYLGRLPKKYVIEAISSSSVYVLPSYREGLPVTVMEAMAMARPIITTDVPGCRETVQQGKNGFLIPERDVSNIVKAMKYFLENPNQVEIMGRVSRKIAEGKFDVHKVNAAIFQAMELT